MPRNFFRRVELAFPVLDQELARRVREEIFAVALADNVNARVLGPDGSYTRRKPGDNEPPSDSQAQLIEMSRRRVQRAAEAFEKGRRDALESADFAVPAPRDDESG